jgi:hypothetical protein
LLRVLFWGTAIDVGHRICLVGAGLLRICAIGEAVSSKWLRFTRQAEPVSCRVCQLQAAGLGQK